MAQFKLTAVTLTFEGVKIQAILDLPLNEKGQPILPTDICNKMLTDIGCTERGDTYSVGG